MTEAERGAPSKAVRVTFFEDRAEVVRRARVRVPAGKSWHTVEGVTPFVDDRSVRVKPDGAAKLLGARVLRRLDAVPSQDPETVAAAEAALREATARLRAADQGRERCEGQLGRVERLFAAWQEAIARVPRGLAEQPAPWRDAHEALVADARAALEAEAGSFALKQRVADEVRAAEMRLRACQSTRSRWEAAIQVQLEAVAETELELELSYRTPCALWRPEHLVRLERESDEAPEGKLALTTFATAWQATGEDWVGVEALFSTARPGRAASPPTVADDALRSREKTAEERREVVVAARDEDVKLTGLDRGRRQVDAMPGVDDGGEPLTLRASEPVDLPSSGEPFRVATGTRELPAGLVRVALPEVAPVAHLRATATLAGELPLLAGPIRLARGEGRRQHLVGRAKVPFVGAGEPFELGFGPDDAVRVRREQHEERDTAWVTGSQTIARKVEVFLSNLSTDVKRVLVKERVPVSELDEVSVSVEAQGWQQDEDGFLTRVVELAPRGEETVRFGYTLKAAAKVRLPF
ncbi:MAG: mucoidy inhibitor MuiA family protein [Planctomycetota bacterium]